MFFLHNAQYLPLCPLADPCEHFPTTQGKEKIKIDTKYNAAVAFTPSDVPDQSSGPGNHSDCVLDLNSSAVL